MQKGKLKIINANKKKQLLNKIHKDEENISRSSKIA